MKPTVIQYSIKEKMVLYPAIVVFHVVLVVLTAAFPSVWLTWALRLPWKKTWLATMSAVAILFWGEELFKLFDKSDYEL